MYEVADGRPRGASASQSGRELPILFHLVDVSRPRAKPVEKMMGEPAHYLAAVESLRSPVAEETPLVTPPAPVSPAQAEEIPQTVAAEAVRLPESVPTPEIAAPPLQTQAMTAEVIEVKPVVISEVIVSEPAVDAEAVREELSAAKSTDINPTATPSSTSAKTEVAAPSVNKKETVAHPVNLRKKAKTSASEDWFASHGKFIAVAFVVALGATIYFARAKREQATVATNEPAVTPLLIEKAPAASETKPSNLWPESMVGSSKGNDGAASRVQTAAATESKVELAAPEMVAETPDSKRKDNLFEFAAAKNEERVAARSDDSARAAALPGPAATVAAENISYPVTSTPASRYPVANAPEANAYPTTSAPASPAPANSAPAYAAPSYSAQGYSAPNYAAPNLPANAPVAPPLTIQPPANQPAAAGGPSIDYRSQYPSAPAPPAQQQAWPPAGYGGQPGSYQPIDNTARGQRNERTGSGTY